MTSSADVEQGIQQLKEEMARAPVMHITNPWANRVPDLADLDPYALPQQKNQKNQKQDQGKEGELDFAELFKGRMTQKEVNDVLMKYKQAPEKIQQFLKNANQKHRQVIELRQAEELNKKLLHRKQMAVLAHRIPPPFVESPNAKYKRDLHNGEMTRQQQFKKLILRQEERELNFAAAEAARERAVVRKLQAA